MSIINEEDELNLKLGGREGGQKIYNAIKLFYYIDELPVGKMYGIQKVSKGITILTKEEVVLKQKYEELKEKIKELEDENYVQKKIIFEDCIPKQELIDKIDELEQDIKEFEQIDNTGRFKRENCISLYKKEVLEELLENNFDITKENKISAESAEKSAEIEKLRKEN